MKKPNQIERNSKRAAQSTQAEERPWWRRFCKAETKRIAAVAAFSGLTTAQFSQMLKCRNESRARMLLGGFEKLQAICQRGSPAQLRWLDAKLEQIIRGEFCSRSQLKKELASL